jgi:hypothetical protein
MWSFLVESNLYSFFVVFFYLYCLKCLIWPVVLYWSEAWALRKDDENRIQESEMWSYRRLLRVKWTDKRTNESVLKELGVQRLMLFEIRKRGSSTLVTQIETQKQT